MYSDFCSSGNPNRDSFLIERPDRVAEVAFCFVPPSSVERNQGENISHRSQPVGGQTGGQTMDQPKSPFGSVPTSNTDNNDVDDRRDKDDGDKHQDSDDNEQPTTVFIHSRGTIGSITVGFDE